MNFIDRGQHSAHQHAVQSQTKQAPEVDTVVIKSVHGPEGWQIIDAADFDPETMELFNGMYRRPGE
jgi:hypothetical protein